jgi:hypothetical protein
MTFVFWIRVEPGAPAGVQRAVKRTVAAGGPGLVATTEIEIPSSSRVAMACPRWGFRCPLLATHSASSWGSK